MTMKLHFLGAAGTVTGSKYLLESGHKKILVDCGLFQGLKDLRLRNREPFPIAARKIDAMILTHAHLDHSGYLPVLVKQGFSGPIYCSEGTRDLCRILLPDSGHLQEEEAFYANKRGFSKHHPALPLYTREDAEAVLRLLKPVPYHEKIDLGHGHSFFLSPVGHILGATSVYVSDGARTVGFSGDVGRPNDALMRAPNSPAFADYFLIESTYGDRRHDSYDSKTELAAIILKTIHRGGIVLIPSFAVGRAQTLLHLIAELKQESRIPDVPVYLNSPMAIDATKLFLTHEDETRLTDTQLKDMGSVATYVNTVEASKALNRLSKPAIIISASGMATGGRILHHLKSFAPDPNNTILLVGFQAAGTRGEALAHGVSAIKIHGEFVPVNAEIARIDSLSAHADYVELGEWLSQMKTPPQATFIVHGERSAAVTFKAYLDQSLKWPNISVAEDGECVVLD